MTREEQALKKIKNFLDAWYNGKIEITVGKEWLYDVGSILGVIRTTAYEGLGEDIPGTFKTLTKDNCYFG